MKILLSGASGLIGSHVAKYFTKLNHKVYKYNRNSETISKFPSDVGTELSINEFDYADVFMHCAATHPAMTSNIVQLFEGNYQITKTLLGLLPLEKVKKIIFLSSTSVYGLYGHGFLGIENQRINPSFYGQIKFECEKYLLEESHIRNIPLHIIRLPAVVANGHHKTFVPTLIESLRNGVRIEVNSKDSLFNHVVYIKDLVHYLSLLAGKNDQSTTTIVGSENPMRIENLIDYICEKCEVKEPNIAYSNKTSGAIDISSAKHYGYESLTTRENLDHYLLLSKEKN